METKEEIEFSDFLEIEKKLDIRFGTITDTERVPKSSKLLKLTVDFGTEKRCVVTNIGNRIPGPSYIQGEQFPFLVNLKPVTIMGIESTAMIIIAEHGGELQPRVQSDGAKLL